MANRWQTILSAALITLIGAALLWSMDVRPGLLTPGALKSTQIHGTKFPITLIDAVGDSIQITEPPQRIVSATLATDEILADLIDPARIAGVTFLADNQAISNVADRYPASIKRIRGEVEEIIALQPDLVFISPYTRAETVSLLLGTSIPVVRLSGFNTLADIESSIQLVAAATGTQKQAEQQLSVFAQRIKQVKNTLAGVEQPRVLFYNLNGSSVGPGSTIDEIIHIAGGHNVIRDTGIKGSQKINEELAISLQPDVILVSGWVDQNGTAASEQLAQRSAWQNVPAVQQKRIYDLNGSWLFATSQFTWEGIEQVAGILHPQLFSAQEPEQ
ncbi:MAG: ABC transporter substrate-binding protein [Neptuniibacter sp.]